MRDSARSVHLPYNAGKQALARTCNLDYSEGLPINCVDRKAFFFARDGLVGLVTWLSPESRGLNQLPRADCAAIVAGPRILPVRRAFVDLP
jgi:hypothetical protein